VFRRLATVVSVAMLSTSGSAAQHIHAYVDHDHGDHHHGPASHRHLVAHASVTDSRAPDAAPRLERCDPGEHAVAVVFTCVAPRPDHVPVPSLLDANLVTAPAPAWRTVAPSDVRAHSPPRLTDAPLRAPPVVHLA
jgi:hypothetical protein